MVVRGGKKKKKKKMRKKGSNAKQATEREREREREVRADPNGSSVLLSPENRVRLLEQEGLCGLPEILGSTPKVRW